MHLQLKSTHPSVAFSLQKQTPTRMVGLVMLAEFHHNNRAGKRVMVSISALLSTLFIILGA
ncbi:MAG: hypothetical protein MUO26_10550 [Methanotrichaceae archaeon]|nr:hypothetical protein [Methanotrichaceae archaeon]